MGIFSPLENLLGFFFTAFFDITQSYGFSIILLSITINTLLIPVYMLADYLKEKENKHQEIMSGDIKSIKKHYAGQEKYYSLRTAYKIYHYNPLLSLRVSLGFLIQIPFFFAAYHYLSHYTGYQQVGFLRIHDLSEPDSWLFGINILPFIMTIINIFTGLIYTLPKKRENLQFFHEKSEKDFIQLLILSLVFLFLLYNAPSALVLYWTTNNIYALIKYTVTKRPVMHDFLYFATKTGNKIIQHEYTGYIAILIFFMIGNFTVMYVSHHWRNADMAVLSIQGAITLLGILSLYMWCYVLSFKKLVNIIHPKKIKGVINLSSICFGVLSVISAIGLLYITQNRGIDTGKSPGLLVLTPNRIRQITFFLFFMTTVSFIPEFLKECRWKIRIKKQFLHITKCYGLQTTQKKRLQTSMYIACFVIYMFIFVIPFQIYITAPIHFSNSINYFLFRIGLFVLISIIGCYIFFRILSKFPSIHYVCTTLIIWITIIALWNGFILNLNLGELINAKFLNDEKLTTIHSFLTYLEIIIMVILLGFIYMYQRNIIKPLSWVMLVFTIMASIQVYNILSRNLALFETAQKKDPLNQHELPPYHQRWASFSKEKNVMLIILDQFPSNMFQDILITNPELKTNLDGFTWYTNTVTAYGNTQGSLPSFIGGDKYTLDKLPGFKTGNFLDNYQQVYEAYAQWSRTLQDYDITFWNPIGGVGTTDYKLYSDINTHFGENTLALEADTGYYPYWLYQQRLKNPDFEDLNAISYFLTKPLIALTVFRTLPFQYKQKLYLDQQWNAYIENHMVKYFTVKHHFMVDETLLDTMPTTSNTQSPKKTFKIYWGESTHAPLYLDETCNLATDAIKHSKYEFISKANQKIHMRCSLERLVRWFNWMKESHIYDNTKIIIASDHGSGDYKWIDKDGNTSEYSAAPFALLLVKDFSQRGALSEDKRLMYTPDIPSILASGMDEYSFPHLNTDFTKIPIEEYPKRSLIYRYSNHNPIVIDGDMYNQDNWHILE